MSLRKQFATDKAKESAGIGIEFGANEDGSVPKFFISRMGKSNKRYQKALEAATRPHRRAIELGTLANDVAERLFMGVFVDSVMVSPGWENVKLSDVTGDDADEGFAPFNKENAVKLFANLPELYDDLQEKAKSAALFRDEALEEEAGN